MDISQLRDKSIVELGQLLQQKLQELLKLRFGVAAQELKQTHLFKSTKKTIARINTVLVEKRK